MSLKLNDIIIVRNQTILYMHEMDSCFRRNNNSFFDSTSAIPTQAGIHSLIAEILYFFSCMHNPIILFMKHNTKIDFSINTNYTPNLFKLLLWNSIRQLEKKDLNLKVLGNFNIRYTKVKVKHFCDFLWWILNNGMADFQLYRNLKISLSYSSCIWQRVNRRDYVQFVGRYVRIFW